MFGLRKAEYIWMIDESGLSPRRKVWLVLLNRLSIMVECISKQYVLGYASALTYNTLLAAVPVLAIVFAVARGFGFDEFVELRLRESLDQSPELADIVLGFVDSYLQHTRGGVFIGVGLVFLLYSLVTLTSNIEMAFNAIWHVGNSRNIYRRIADYLSVFLLLPFAIIILSGFNIFLISFRSILPDYQFVSDTVEHIVQFSPLGIACVAFILLYKFMPNTRVQFRHTVWPGITAGVLFMGVEYLYIHYQIKISSYNAIYGSFAALPLFMIWLQLSWSICLLGGLLCYANQNVEYYAVERASYDLSRRQRDTLILLLVSRLCKHFVSGLTPYTERTLAKEVRLPETVVRMLLSDLVGMGIIAETRLECDEYMHYLPAMDVNRITVQSVVRMLDKYGSESLRGTWHTDVPELETIRCLRYDGRDALLKDI